MKGWLGFALLLIGLPAVMPAQTADKPAALMQFEAADVHTSLPSSLAGTLGGVFRSGRYSMQDATMVDLITAAYDVDPDRVTGGPSWLGTDHFDVIAKTPPGTTSVTAKVMLQNLLADRFKLAVQKDTKTIPAFILTAGKGGMKMKPASGSGEGCQGQPPAGPPQPGVFPPIVVSCHNMTMDEFADQVRRMAGGYLDHPVVNQTKLEGAFDFDIKWTGRGQLAAAGADGISIFDAVDKQLGLKLELQSAPLPVITVASVNRMPTPNRADIATIIPPEATAFEAAEIKAVPADSQGGLGFRYNPGGRIDGTGTLLNLMAVAYDIPPNIFADMVTGAPDWMKNDRFNIVAKAPATSGPEVAPPISQLQLMLRNLINDRFKLKTHMVEQQATVYALLLPKELKLTKASDNERAGCNPDPVAAQAMHTPGAFECRNTTMAELGKFIQMRAGAYIDHPIVDATGLTGGYDFKLGWTPKQLLQAPKAAEAGSEAADPTGISLFEAVEKQLGLKLEVQKRALQIYVIDHVEKLPE